MLTAVGSRPQHFSLLIAGDAVRAAAEVGSAGTPRGTQRRPKQAMSTMGGHRLNEALTSIFIVIVVSHERGKR